MIKVTILLAEMYLASLILNTIQVCRVYKNVMGELPFIVILQGFWPYLSDPRINFIGIVRAFRDWYWLDKRAYIDEDETFRMHTSDEMEDA